MKGKGIDTNNYKKKIDWRSLDFPVYHYDTRATGCREPHKTYKTLRRKIHSRNYETATCSWKKNLAGRFAGWTSTARNSLTVVTEKPYWNFDILVVRKSSRPNHEIWSRGRRMKKNIHENINGDAAIFFFFSLQLRNNFSFVLVGTEAARLRWRRRGASLETEIMPFERNSVGFSRRLAAMTGRN